MEGRRRALTREGAASREHCCGTFKPAACTPSVLLQRSSWSLKRRWMTFVGMSLQNIKESALLHDHPFHTPMACRAGKQLEEKRKAIVDRPPDTGEQEERCLSGPVVRSCASYPKTHECGGRTLGAMDVPLRSKSIEVTVLDEPGN